MIATVLMPDGSLHTVAGAMHRVEQRLDWLVDHVGAKVVKITFPETRRDLSAETKCRARALYGPESK